MDNPNRIGISRKVKVRIKSPQKIKSKKFRRIKKVKLKTGSKSSTNARGDVFSSNPNKVSPATKPSHSPFTSKNSNSVNNNAVAAADTTQESNGTAKRKTKIKRPRHIKLQKHYIHKSGVRLSIVKDRTIRKTIKKTIRKNVKKVAVAAAKEAALAPLKAHKTAAKKALEQGKQSTDFGDGSEISQNARAAEIMEHGVKKISNPESVTSAVRKIRKAPGNFKKNITGINQNVKTTKKAVNGIKSSVKSMNAAVQNFRRAQYINSIVTQSKGQAALYTTKNVGQLVVNITKDFLFLVINAVKTIVSSSNVVYFIAAFIVLIIVIVMAIGTLLFSAYGIFIADDIAKNPLTIEQIVRKVNADYQNEIEKITNEYDNRDVSWIRYEGNKMQWKYILALYAVKYSCEGEDILTVDEKSEERIKDIFYKIHSISAKYVEEHNPHADYAGFYVDPNWTVLVITTTARPLSDIMDDMKFTKDQRKQVTELVTGETDEMWINVLYGHSGNGGQALARVAKKQIGQTPQTYTSWESDGNKEWTGSFVCWCANEIGYVTQGLYPRSNDKNAIMNWFKDRGLWENPDRQPNIGDTIFLSTKGDGQCDLCGIVERVENNNVYYITHDTLSELVASKNRSLENDRNTIIGYGVLPLMSGLRGDSVEEQIYNYLRQDGYSPIAACAVLGNIQADCGCDPEEFGKDHGYYTGILRWNGSEMTDFMDWCSDNAYDYRYLESQLVYYDYWVDQLSNWGSRSVLYHPNINAVTSTAGFKSIKASDYDDDTAQALYAAAVTFADDIARPVNQSYDEKLRYSYAVAFYNCLVSDTVDGSSVSSAWLQDKADEIGVWHEY